MKGVSEANRYPIEKVTPSQPMDAYLNSNVSPKAEVT